jgi:hypothetical protein
MGPILTWVRQYLDAGPDRDGFLRFWTDELQTALADVEAPAMSS